MENRPFERIVSFEEFLAEKNLEQSQLRIAKTTSGKIVMTARGSVISTIKTELQAATAAETAANIGSVMFCFGIPKAGAVDQQGRPSLPCLMESKSQWEEVTLF